MFKKTKYMQCLYEDMRHSTIHGLNYVANENIHVCERLFWIGAFCLNVGFMLYVVGFQVARFIVSTGNTNTLVERPAHQVTQYQYKLSYTTTQYPYKESPTVMSVEMDYFNWNISYPAFTMCPASKYDEEEFKVILNEINNRTGKNVEIYLRSIVTANMDTLWLLDFDIPPDILKAIHPSEYAQLTAAVFKKFDNTSMTTNTNWPISIEEVMTELGMCHVVNSNVAVFSNPHKWNESVTYENTNILLSIHDQGFFTQITDYAEIYKVFVHSPDEPILTSTQSYVHSQRGFVSFGVTVWSTKISDDLRSAPIRLRRCRHIDEPINKRYSIYSYNFCIMECRIKMILKLCGCIPHFYKPLDNEKICSLKDLVCVMENRKEILRLAASNDTLSRFKDKSNLPRNSHDCGCIGRCESDQFFKDYENFVSHGSVNRLKIGVSAFPKVRVVRQIIYNGYDGFLKIAGVINMCTGASIISMFELLESFIRIPIRNLAIKIGNIISSYNF